MINDDYSYKYNTGLIALLVIFGGLESSSKANLLEKRLNLQEFCEKAKLKNCKEKMFDQVGSAYDRLTSAKLLKYVSEPESVKAGMLLYLQELANNRFRMKSVKCTSVGDLFYPKTVGFCRKKIVPFQVGLIDNLSPTEMTHLTTFLKNKDLQNLTGTPVRIAGNCQGNSGATTRVNNERGFFYHKSLPKQGPLAVKKMAAEVNAYLLNQLLNYDFVSETFLANYNAVPGSVQKEIPAPFVAVSALKVETKESGESIDAIGILSIVSKDNKSDLDVFTYLGSVVDRHKGNIFVDPLGGKVKSIDHETGFHYPIPPRMPSDSLSGNLPEEYSAKTRSRLSNLTREEIQKALGATLSQNQIEELYLRVQIVKADIIRKYGVLEPKIEGDAEGVRKFATENAETKARLTENSTDQVDVEAPESKARGPQTEAASLLQHRTQLISGKDLRKIE